MPISCQTKYATIPLSIKNNEIHLWQVNPNEITSPELLNKYKNLLSDDETKKQQRYKFFQDRHDALITRAFVRNLLSYYADVLPNDWHFERGEKDKPELVNPPLPLKFNISHTKGLIICAVTLENDIGCDVENTTRNNDVLAIADRYFSAIETNELFSLPKDQQRHRFFDYWTLKESYIKAWGLGLAIPLKDFSFSIIDETPEVDDAVNKSTPFVIKNTINIRFASHRIDNAERWRHWLLYPKGDDQHRIAIAIRAKDNNQDVDYQLRFFNTIPLIGYKESEHKDLGYKD
jgi:4'-phosphopantetheinyl transferase